MSTPTDNRLRRVQLFHDPTPNALLNQRIIQTMLQILMETTLSAADQEYIVRVLVLIAIKMVSVWNHKERFIAEQARLMFEAERQPPSTDPPQDVTLSQELFSEFDEFLVQIKSTLDYLVKIPVPVFGKNTWNLRTFGAKGEDVLKVLRHNLPVEYKHAAKTFELAIFDRHKGWLNNIINMRDNINHYLERGVSHQGFVVLRVGNEIKIPMYSADQTVEQVMNLVWPQLIQFVEDFVALTLSFKLKGTLSLFRNPQPLDSPVSPWRIATDAQKERLINTPGWEKVG